MVDQRHIIWQYQKGKIIFLNVDIDVLMLPYQENPLTFCGKYYIIMDPIGQDWRWKGKYKLRDAEA